LTEEHKSGYVNIIGRPNVGKSTLMNALVGERLSIITNKPQTTRHRIIGIWNDDNHQIIFSDTPGIIEDPNYGMHKYMNKFAYSIFDDADVVLFVVDKTDDYDGDELVFKLLKKVEVPIFLIVNKIDISTEEQIAEMEAKYSGWINFSQIFRISALLKENTTEIFTECKKLLPVFPPFYPKDQLTDRPEKFFVSEIIREKILELYKEEIPYCAEVEIEKFEDTELRGEPFARIFANIYVMRKSQKMILLGKGGSAIKKLGIESRKTLEEFLGKRLHLELYVRVKDKWRDDDRLLKSFGYSQ